VCVCVCVCVNNSIHTAQAIYLLFYLLGAGGLGPALGLCKDF